LKQIRLELPDLPQLDNKKTKSAVEGIMEKYRLYKYVSFEEREASTTASWSDTPKGFTGTKSDQTANIAIHNVDQRAARKSFCERVERAVNELPKMERFLIQKRYMTNDSDYITDHHVYNFEFQPPRSKDTYGKIRNKAFYRLILKFDDLNILRLSDVSKGE